MVLTMFRLGLALARATFARDRRNLGVLVFTHNSRLLVRQDGVSILSKSKCQWESASLRSYASFSAGHGRVLFREQPPSAGGGSEGVVVGKLKNYACFNRL